MEIHSLYSLDIFLQGFFLLFCIAFSFYLVFQDNLEKFKDIHSIKGFSKRIQDTFDNIVSAFSVFNKSESKSKIKSTYIGLIPLIIVLSFIIGILGNGIAEKWIDSERKNHLSIKPSLDSTITGTKKIKDELRNRKFEKIFSTIIKSEKEKKFTKQLYYDAKHDILKEDIYYSYLRKSQSLAEYSRVFALGFFILLIGSILNITLMVLRIPFDSRITITKQKSRKENKTSEEIWSRFSRIYGDKKIFVSNGIIVVFSGIAFFILAIYTDDIPAGSPLSSNIIKYLPCFICLLNVIPLYKPLRFSFFLYAAIYFFSTVGYYTSFKIWKESEDKVAGKVFGIYKSMNTNINSEMEEFLFLRDRLKIKREDTLLNQDSK